jgi:hypothetical protein
MTSNNFWQITICCLALLGIFALTSPSQSGQSQSPPATKEPDAADASDDDEKLDASFRRFGLAAGAAYQCTPESGKEKLVDDVLHAFSRIGQLFGTDRAFYFAASFGRGTDQPFDKAKCAELIEKLRESRLVRRLAK